MKTKTRKYPCGCEDTIKGLRECPHKETRHTPTDTAMENIAVLDLLTREGYSDGIIDRIERAVNSHEELIHSIKYTLQNLEAGYKEKIITAPKTFHIQLNESMEMLYKALKKAEGK